jgi:hypothetical protein
MTTQINISEAQTLLEEQGWKRGNIKNIIAVCQDINEGIVHLSDIYKNELSYEQLLINLQIIN